MTHMNDRSNTECGDYVIFLFNPFNMMGCTLKNGDIVQNAYGKYYHDDCINIPFGAKVLPRDNPNGIPVAILRPAPELVTTSLSHRTQILYHADILTTIQLLQLHPGCRVIEAGTGSGSLTTSLARAIAPQGKVFTFEFHLERYQKAQEEFANYGILDHVKCHHRDVCGQGFPTELDATIDAVFLDLPAPWLAIPHAHKALKPGKRIVLFSPCIEQVMRTTQLLTSEEYGYHDVDTIEVISKPWGIKYKTNEDRKQFKKFKKENVKESEYTPEPEHIEVFDVMSYPLAMRGHTGYLTVATKPSTHA